MNRRARAAVAVVLALCIAAPAGVAGAAPPATAALRPAHPTLAPSGELPLVPVALNRRGQVLGYGTLADGPDIQLWDRGTLIDVTEGEFAFPLALGEDGDVLGLSVVSGTGLLRAVLRVDGERVALDDVLAPGAGINGRGQATLSRGEPEQAPTVGVWQDGAFRPAPLPPGRPAHLASINEQGVAVGVTAGQDGDPVPEAVAWDTRTGRLTRLGRLGGPTEAWVVNEAGTIAGVAHPQGGGAARTWVRRDGRLVDIGTLGGPGASLAEGVRGTANADRSVNILGDLVGQSDTADGEKHAFLHRGGRMVDLGTLGGPNSEAHAVNMWGQVVGVSDTASGAQHGFLWQGGHMADLGPVGRGGPAVPPPPLDINDRGTIVASAPDGTSGLTWSVSPFWGARG